VRIEAISDLNVRWHKVAWHGFRSDREIITIALIEIV
jgi:hypothetical protein